MKFVRFQFKDEEPRFGWIHDNRVGVIEGNPFGDYRLLEAEFSLESLKIKAPVEQGKIICMGKNYAEHAREFDSDVPDVPLIFMKPFSSVIGFQEKIVLPPQSQHVDHEGELAVIIGKKGRWIPTERAFEWVFGYTIANDVTARDLQRRDGQWTRAKGFDTFCPLGPWIETDFDPVDALITVRVNGEIRQMATTRDMVFSIPQIIAFISSIMTLEAGDIILTGTPAGVGELTAGDGVTVEIEGIGILENPVMMENKTK